MLNIQYTCSSGCCLDMKVMDLANGGSICYSFFFCFDHSHSRKWREVTQRKIEFMRDSIQRGPDVQTNQDMF